MKDRVPKTPFATRLSGDAGGDGRDRIGLQPIEERTVLGSQMGGHIHLADGERPNGIGCDLPVAQPHNEHAALLGKRGSQLLQTAAEGIDDLLGIVRLAQPGLVEGEGDVFSLGLVQSCCNSAAGDLHDTLGNAVGVFFGEGDTPCTLCFFR